MATSLEISDQSTPSAHARAVPGFLLDLAAVAALVALAAAVRLPGLLTVPRFTDEQLDVLYTLPLYRLQGLPVVAFDPYNGPLYSYLLAVTLWLLGPEPYTPRLMVLLLGLATVAATYWLGRSLGGRAAGLVAGGLLVGSAVHVVVNSHIAWSNATTPLFTTLAFCIILPAVTRGSGPRLALGALAFALALQTHPSVAFFLPGVALAVLLKQPALVRSRWTVIAGLLFVLGYSNMLAYHLFIKGEEAYWEQAKQVVPTWARTADDAIGRLDHEQRMNAEGQSGPRAYPQNLATLGGNLPRVAANLIEPRPLLSDFLREPTFWLYGALILVGLAWPLRHGNPLPILAGLSFLLLLPLFNGKYEPIFNGRYLMPVVVLAYAGLGSLVPDLWRTQRGQAGRAALVLITVGLVLYPLLPLLRYHTQQHPEGQVSHDLIQTVAAISAARRADEPLLLDDRLGRRGLAADGDLLMNLEVFLQFRDVPYRVGPASAGRLEPELGGARSAIVVFAEPYDRPLDSRYRFTRIEDAARGRYAAYRLERR
jgi:4-amino-4-deoxy-L-arabinose transferase-like glycosyltransferase